MSFLKGGQKALKRGLIEQLLKYVLNGLKQHDLGHKKIVKTLRYAKLLKALKVHTVGKSQFVSKLKKNYEIDHFNFRTKIDELL